MRCFFVLLIPLLYSKGFCMYSTVWKRGSTYNQRETRIYTFVFFPLGHYCIAYARHGGCGLCRERVERGMVGTVGARHISVVRPNGN